MTVRMSSYSEITMEQTARRITKRDETTEAVASHVVPRIWIRIVLLRG